MLSKVGLKNNISFGEALSTKERQEYENVSKQAEAAMDAIRGPKDKSILIVHDACLPQNASNNTGWGHLSSEESASYFSLMKSYLGINIVETLPPGRPSPDRNCYCAYASTGTSLGEHEINAELLTTPEYGSIMKKEEFDDIVKANTDESIQATVKGNDIEKPVISKETIVNFENVIDDNSAFDKSMRKAYDRFLESKDPKAAEMKKQFEAYKTENNEVLEPKGIFEVLRKEHQGTDFSKWGNEVDRELYNPDFDAAKRQARKSEIIQDSAKAKEIDFYKFKQFIADEHLKQGRKSLNSEGIKTFGDCLIGFSRDEVWANPKAFLKDNYIGLPDWKLPALDYEKLKNPESESSKMLKRKVGFFAKRYDGIRFDVSWAYVAPIISPKGTTELGTPISQGSHILEMIEKTVKDAKEANGEKYEPKDLIHEFEGGNEFDGDNLREPVKPRIKVYGSTHMSEDWGSNDAFLKRDFGGADSLVVGVGNHDPMPLKQLSELDDNTDSALLEKWADNEFNPSLKKGEEPVTAATLKARKENQIKPLARILNLDENTLRTNRTEYINAKFAEPVMAKNNMVFYMDVLGRRDRFDCQARNAAINYRFRITDKFESEYHTALQEGRGFNKMDSYAKIFDAGKLKEKHPELYQKIIYFRDKLVKKGAKTEAEANKAAKVDSCASSIPSPKSSKSKVVLGIIGAVAVLGGIFAYSKSKPNTQNSNT